MNMVGLETDLKVRAPETRACYPNLLPRRSGVEALGKGREVLGYRCSASASWTDRSRRARNEPTWGSGERPTPHSGAAFASAS